MSVYLETTARIPKKFIDSKIYNALPASLYCIFREVLKQDVIFYDISSRVEEKNLEMAKIRIDFMDTKALDEFNLQFAHVLKELDCSKQFLWQLLMINACLNFSGRGLGTEYQNLVKGA
jgi:hypothetical protein